MNKKWNSQVTIKFLERYEANPCLWDVSSTDYKNRELREIAYENISKSMQIEGFDSKPVKAKIRSIRNAYALERAKVIKSKTSGKGTDEIYTPKVPWFPVADRILTEVVQSRESQSTEIIESTQEVTQQMPVGESETINDESLEDSTSTSAPINTPKSNKVSRKPVILVPPKKARIEKGKAQSHTEKAIKDLREITEQLNNPSDDNEFDCFGRNMACQLKLLPEAIALESMAYIQFYIVQQRLKCINNVNKGNNQPSSIIHHEERRPYSSLSNYEYEYLPSTTNNQDINQPFSIHQEESRPYSSSTNNDYDYDYSTSNTNSPCSGDILSQAINTII